MKQFKGLCGKVCGNCIMKVDRLCRGCSMCDINFCNCNNDKVKRCMVICPKKFGSFALVKSMLRNNVLLENKDIKLPVFIPIMPDRVNDIFDFSSTDNTIAVHGEFLLTASGEHISLTYKNKGFNKALNIDGVKAIAEFYIKDRALEGFWNNRKEIYKELKDQNFLGIIIPKKF